MLIKAKFDSICDGCTYKISKGSAIDWFKGHRGNPSRAYHAGCAPTGHASLDREYMQGVRDVNNWRENKLIFGEEEAERMEIERELREGWDY